MIHYQVFLENPHAHYFRVQMTLPQSSKDGEILSLPAWIPGSYTLRDFSKHITHIQAYDAHDPKQELDIRKLDSHTYQCEPHQSALTVEYTVYAWDRSVRGAHFDLTHAFFNGTALFLCSTTYPESPIEVTIHRPKHTYHDKPWSVATTMPVRRVDDQGFGDYQVSGYKTLIDYPVEIGEFQVVHFEVNAVPHQIVLTGSFQADTQRLSEDVQKICLAQAELFKDIPFEEYRFLLTVMEEGYGGLEHQSSSALMAQKKCLPFVGMSKVTKDYKTLLGLISHEYFHAWNVKRIKPLEFYELDLRHPRHTYQLWAFEGFTSYYDDLMLQRSKVVTTQDYCELLAGTISRVYQGQGRFKQTVKESSFDAWTKFYKPNENTLNSEVSYYTKGSLCALMFDLMIRLNTQSQKSLDDVMRLLWQRYGKCELGVPEGAIEQIIIEVGTAAIKNLVHQALETTQDLSLEETLKAFGITLTWDYPDELKSCSAQIPVSLGIRFSGTELVKIDQVILDSPAQKAGLSALDILIAIDDCRVTAKNLNGILERKKPGDSLMLHVFREERLLTLEAFIEQAPKSQAHLTLDENLTQDQLMLRRAWLGE